jgi:protease-4
VNNIWAIHSEGIPFAERVLGLSAGGSIKDMAAQALDGFTALMAGPSKGVWLGISYKAKAKGEDGRPIPFALLPQGTNKGNGGRVAIIPMYGALSKYATSYTMGMDEIAGYINQANADPAVIGSVLDCYTPGGTVWGVMELAQVVALSTKPIIAYVDGMMASAGYWVGSQTKGIIINPDAVSSVGSIGVLQMFADKTNSWFNAGEVISLMRSSGSPDKVTPNGYETLTPEQKASVVSELDSIKTLFDQAVQDGRGAVGATVAPEALTGKMYTADQAIALGLADKKGTLNDAIAWVVELAKQTDATNTVANTSMSKVNGEGQPGAEVTVEAELVAAQATISEGLAALAAANAQVQEVTAQLEAIRGELATATATIAAHEVTIQGQTAELTQLRAWKAGAEAVPTGGAGDAGMGNGKEATVMTDTDRKALDIFNKKG